MVRPDPTGFSEPVLESSAQVRVGVFTPRPLVRSLPGFSFSGTLESASRILDRDYVHLPQTWTITAKRLQSLTNGYTVTV